MSNNPMTKPASLRLPDYTIDYWIRSSTAGGRLRLKLRFQSKLWLWKVVVFFAHGLKRFLDIIGSSMALLLSSPIFAITALLIKLEDSGPVFFKQTRVGNHGKSFTMWKFRSMVTNADKIKDQLKDQNEMNGGVIFKMKEDPRITFVGKYIRKYSIDELPQFWNVLIGDMALVGPRPSLPREVAEYSAEERQRLLVKPGITCLWQVSGRSEINFSGQVQLDLAYIRSSSVLTDLKLLLKTIPAVLLGKGAY
jgi:exopolysaccharide biosynthesis polyprenyl glycosylphosphotransferase